jgi:hypothetical protein
MLIYCLKLFRGISLRSEFKSDDIKGTVLPDIGLYFRFWKITLVFSAGPLMVLYFFYFVFPEIFNN